MNELISVIIPVYNVKKYLNRCIESVLKQTYDNLQIVLIDDGSSDGSEKICDEWKEKDNRIAVIHQKNRGLSGARNTGISVAKGRYITFVDSDDWIDKRMIEVLYNNLTKYNADMSICEFKKSYGENDKLLNNSGEVIVYNQKEALEAIYKYRKTETHVPHKLYKTEIFSDVKFYEGIKYEDLEIFIKLLLQSKKVVYMPDQYYYYFSREDSIVNSKFDKSQLDIMFAAERNIKDIENTYPELLRYVEYAWIDKYIFIFKKAICDGYELSYFKENYRKFKQYSKGYLDNPGITLRRKFTYHCLNININLFILMEKINTAYERKKHGK